MPVDMFKLPLGAFQHALDSILSVLNKLLKALKMCLDALTIFSIVFKLVKPAEQLFKQVLKGPCLHSKGPSQRNR